MQTGRSAQGKIITVRRAETADIPSIVTIHNSSVLKREDDPSLGGFLLKPVSSDQVSQWLSQPSCSLFVATDKGGGVLGFAAISTDLPAEVLEVRWYSDEYREQMTRNEHCHVLLLAVKQEAAGQGVARALYASLYQQYRKAIISSFVVNKPFANQRSLEFHEKQGFECLGRFSRGTFAGLEGYESCFMVRFTDGGPGITSPTPAL